MLCKQFPNPYLSKKHPYKKEKQRHYIVMKVMIQNKVVRVAVGAMLESSSESQQKNIKTELR
jgi:hypothetical protein